MSLGLRQESDFVSFQNWPCTKPQLETRGTQGGRIWFSCQNMSDLENSSELQDETGANSGPLSLISVSIFPTQTSSG